MPEKGVNQHQKNLGTESMQLSTMRMKIFLSFKAVHKIQQKLFSQATVFSGGTRQIVTTCSVYTDNARLLHCCYDGMSVVLPKVSKNIVLTLSLPLFHHMLKFTAGKERLVKFNKINTETFLSNQASAKEKIQ